MNPLPILEQSSNKTGRLIGYTVQKRGVIYHLIKHVVTPDAELIRDVRFLYSTLNFEKLNEAIIAQGFIPMQSDNPAILIEYL